MITPLWNDRPIASVEEDRFDFHDYAEALGQIVLDGTTPITIGIFGPWGSGKTSLMRLISACLLGRRTAEHRRAHVIWFNAWQYERDESAIWRSLLLRVLEALHDLELSPQDIQQIEDWETRLYTDVHRQERGSMEIDWPRLGRGALRIGLSFVPGPNRLLDLFEAIEGKGDTVDALVGAVRHEEIEVYRRQLRFLEEFERGFSRLVNEYIWSRNRLLVIFVDDLDRCLPDRALQVLETIKLFLDVPGCAFFLGADHERIEDVVRQRYGSQPADVGEHYLEKLVQLPFSLPPLEETQMDAFVAGAAPALSPAVRRIFAQGLPPNPRMVKRILNIFQLLQTLAERRVTRDKLMDVDPSVLAKMVVIQGRYRELYQSLLEHPNLIQELEVRARGEIQEHDVLVIPGLESTTRLVETFAERRPLMRILRLGTPFTDLTPTEIGGYLHLTLTTGQDQATHVDPNQQLWDDMLSGDFLRIRAAVDAVQRRGGLRADYAAALAKLLRRERATSLEQRLSAAWTLGYLGDPRDLDATATILAGEFPFGEEQLPYYLLAYRIGRYPVTNAQYARFLADNPDVPVPYVDEPWAQVYNWDPEQRTYPEGKGNSPVVLVTWDEAVAYCSWSGGRLPTQEEWERAARGTDGRAYPWGDTFDPTWANTRESGLGSPTPVGVYPEGESAEGLLDMAGNVWEWTSSDYNLQTKVIRGGAWNFPAESARTFVSERSRPTNRSHAISFRVAFSISKASQASS
jgi:hypothetical protein